MQFLSRCGLTLAFGLMGLLALACEKDTQEAQRFPRSDTQQRQRHISELKFVQLANGVSLYMQEELGDDMVALEVFYRGGYFHEPRGQVQVSHLTEHAILRAPTASYGREEALDRLKDGGMMTGEAIGGCSHFDYFIRAEMMDETLKIEAERLTSARFDKDLIDEQAETAGEEIKKTLTAQGGAMTKFGLMALNQVVNHGARSVPIHAGTFERTPAQVTAYHAARFRPDDMVIVMIGGFDMAEGEQLVRKHFENLPQRPEPEGYAHHIKGDVDVTWDIDTEAVYIVFPGPYETFKERLILTMFGTFMQRGMTDSPTVYGLARATYATSQVNPVRDMPLFVFAQTTGLASVEQLRDELLAVVDERRQMVDERIVSVMRQQSQRFVESSMIRNLNPHIPRQRFIGQEALNVGLRHIFREGMDQGEFISLLRSITYEDVQATLERYVSNENRCVVTFRGE